ncbi:MAG: replication-associated recombination protein A [Chitinophagales bacterium]|nr:replication-associated recombination protein A [Bacteroidota bacterium]
MNHKPLAARLRPQNIDEYIGQQHLLGEGKPLRLMLDRGFVSSLILWGPPGVGKTSLAQLLASKAALPFRQISAINSGVKDMREIIEQAKSGGSILLFVDEIHRFSKSQQDALLGAVENGDIVLIGATTENPSFEVIPALLSRCAVYVLAAFSEQEMLQLLANALEKDMVLQAKNIALRETDALLYYSGGDARKLFNILDMLAESAHADAPLVIDNYLVENLIQQNSTRYDKSGEQHYDLISAFIKSLRGSDPNAALYWMARMLLGGEDPLFIARRMFIFAAEDIGNANPTALILANTCFDACHKIGYPECRIILSQTCIYLANSLKSNAAYTAIEAAFALAQKNENLNVPLHLRNAPTRLMKDLNYGKNYRYPHQFEGNFVVEEYLPEKISGTKIFTPGNNPRENEMAARLKHWWKDKYRY